MKHVNSGPSFFQQETSLYAILLFKEANGDIVIDGRSYPLHQQKVFILPPDATVKFLIHLDYPADYYQIRFHALQAADKGHFAPAELNCPRLWTSIIFGANLLTAFIFSPIWGKLADRYGRKLMLVRSGISMAIIITLMGFATNHIYLLLLRLLNGMMAGFIPAAIALTATNTPKEKTGYALGILHAGSVAGTICGPLLGGLLADSFGFSAVFSYTGLCIFAATMMVIFLVKENFEKKKGK